MWFVSLGMKDVAVSVTQVEVQSTLVEDVLGSSLGSESELSEPRLMMVADDGSDCEVWRATQLLKPARLAIWTRQVLFRPAQVVPLGNWRMSLSISFFLEGSWLPLVMMVTLTGKLVPAPVVSKVGVEIAVAPSLPGLKLLANTSNVPSAFTIAGGSAKARVGSHAAFLLTNFSVADFARASLVVKSVWALTECAIAKRAPR